MNQLIENYKKRNQNILRHALSELRDRKFSDDKSIIRDALNFATGKDDYEQVKKANQLRYATIIKTAKGDETNRNDPSSDYNSYYQVGYKDGDMAAFEVGQYPTISTGIGTTISRTLACLFTSPGQSWKYLVNDKPSEDVETLCQMHRDAGTLSRPHVPL